MFLTNLKDIRAWLNHMGIENYRINEDLSVDVDGVGVDISGKKLRYIPVQFGRVNQYFICTHNELTSLKGCPKIIDGHFYCSHNKLTSLKYGPKEVNGSFYCNNNQLTSLKYGPKEVNGNFYYSNNRLTSLKYGPKEIYGNFNRLTSLKI